MEELSTVEYRDHFSFLIRSLRLTKLIFDMYEEVDFNKLTETIDEICVILIMLDVSGLEV